MHTLKDFLKLPVEFDEFGCAECKSCHIEDGIECVDRRVECFLPDSYFIELKNGVIYSSVLVILSYECEKEYYLETKTVGEFLDENKNIKELILVSDFCDSETEMEIDDIFFFCEMSEVSKRIKKSFL